MGDMDLEAPADAWYVWAGASIMTVALAGVALSMPTHPPPDAQQVANTIDSVAGTELGGTAAYDHDAEMVRIDPQGVSMRNDGGTQHASISFGRLAPVYDDSDLEEVLYGVHPTDHYTGNDSESWRAFHEDVQDAQTLAESPVWRIADGTLRVRTIVYEHPDPSVSQTERAILVDA